MVSSKWLDQHLEEFVRPILGSLPTEASIHPDIYPINQFDDGMLRCLLACWREGKRLAQGRQIFLAGRDVWLFEVLARLEGFPTIFRADISSMTKDYVTEDYTNCHLLDTGYAGSVPRALKIKNFHLVLYRPHFELGTFILDKKKEHMIFPLANDRKPVYGPPSKPLKINRWGNPITTNCYPIAYQGYVSRILELAGRMEAVPKYWVQGNTTYEPLNKVVIRKQSFSPKSIFAQAAALTVHVARYAIPRLHPHPVKKRHVISLGRGI